MLNRREVLLIALMSAIAPFLSSCRTSNNSLVIKVLEDSIPPQLLGDFKKQFPLDRTLDIKPISQLESLYQFLENAVTKDNQKTANLVTLGDIWLEKAIKKELIQPLTVNSLRNWEMLPASWQKLVQRDRNGNLDARGEVWGIPYRWGSTVIAYREDQFRQAGYDPPTDWGDLWREELRDRISLLNQPREVIGLTLKKLGFSYNTPDLDSISDLKTALKTLNQQVKFYSSQSYLQPLILEDTWVAVGWSNDLLQLRTRYPDIKTIIPRSGTALWADLWVNPTGNEAISEAILQWIDFCLNPKAANQIGIFTNASSPIFINANRDKIPKSLGEDKIKKPSSEVLEKSEFLLPLSPKTEEQYQGLWQGMRII